MARQAGSSPRVRGKPGDRLSRGEPRRLIPACAGKTASRLLRGGPPPAHPRVCGENYVAYAMREHRAGSSPRVRGKRIRHASMCIAPGLIPACAGKTASPPAGSPPRGAHPRVCGENCETLAVSGTTRGSSPRVRGKLKGSSPFRSTFGLIPARAGKTSIRSYRAILTAAHPRACGENLPEPAGPEMNRGSSPRVRGKPRLSCVLPSLLGPIPARAGKTSLVVQEDSGMRAHPRACGENLAGDEDLHGWSGSSPRVRGKRDRRRNRDRSTGLIPARAGKTSSRASSPPSAWAHPRACGENKTQVLKAHFGDGSSPRVRGKPDRQRRRRQRQRLIPARAGKTPIDPVPARTPGAHPRACGENIAPIAAQIGEAGSSPRVRGKPCH